MRWKKLGLVSHPKRKNRWNHYYCMMPTPILIDGEVIRVFYGTTDDRRFGRTTFVDLDAGNPSRVIEESDKVILDLGEPGTFDDSGAIVSSIVRTADKSLLYYVGFQRTQLVPYMLFCGLAVSRDLVQFTRYSQAPIIDRSNNNIYSNAAPFVMLDDDENIFKMWFWSGRKWTSVDGKLYLSAEIHYATSADGISWKPEARPCLVPDERTEFSLGRPWVIKEAGLYKMYYSVRRINELYRLGYAESFDGKTWTRMDDKMNLPVSSHGWDSEMVCYPAVIKTNDKTYLFYNGNNNGETGFGVAELIED